MNFVGRDYVNTYKGNLTKEVLMLEYNYTMSAFFFDKDALLEIGGFDEGFTRHQNYELLLRFFEKFEIGNIEEPLFLRGKNDGNNILKGKKAEVSKKLFLKKFKNTINKFDRCNKKKIYVRNYMKLFRTHYKKNHILCLKNFFKSFLISPKICISEIHINKKEIIQNQSININKLPNLLINKKDSVEISIIIPAYNVEKYIFECVNSVIENTFKNIEIICINDGSTDKTLNILKEISKKDTRLKIYSQNNQGLGAARNKGFSLAKGKYIWYLDADDTIDKRALEYLYYELENNNLDMLLFNANPFFENENLKYKYGFFKNAYSRKYNYIGVKEGKHIFTQLNYCKDYKPSACLYITKKTFLEEKNISFIEGIIYEDNIYTLQCMTLAKRVMYKNIKLYNRRIREGSIMTTKNPKLSIKSFIIVLSELSNFVKKYDLIQDDRYYTEFLNRCENIIGQAFNKIKKINKDELLEIFQEIKFQEKYEKEEVFFHMLINLKRKLEGKK